MSDRIDQYLEGNLNREEVAADERADADAAVRAISDTRAFIGARPAPDMTAAVMQRVKHGPHDDRVRRAGVVAGLLRLLWTPREISIRPVYAFATAGAVLAVALLVVPRGLETQTSALRTATVTVDPRLFVQLRLQTD